jgi:putative heme-binding domain-containing protein
MNCRTQAILLATTLCVSVSGQLEPRDRIIVETLIKLNKFDVEGNPKWKGAVLRYAASVRGSEEHLDIVRKFTLKEECSPLLDTIIQKPRGSHAANATRLLIDLGKEELLANALRNSSKQAPEILILLGFTKHKASAKILVSYLDSTPNSKLRESAARALLQVGDNEQKTLAQKHLGDTPSHVNNAPMDIARLAKKTGDPTKGRIAFQKLCFACHKADDIGIDFGPALTEIGSKLPKSELYLSILNPNAGVSFDYEGWILNLKDGTQTAGIIQSETDDEIVLRMIGGVRQTFAKKTIRSREKMKTSLMPPGLHLAMKEQELVDLVEFLSGLKKE